MSARILLAIVAFGFAEIAMIIAYQLVALMSEEMRRAEDPGSPFDDLPRIEQIPLFMRHYRRFCPNCKRLAYLRTAITVHLGGFFLAGIFLVAQGL
jgi:hypothetical protein